MFGAATDCAEHRTRTVHNCGRNPVFDETCEFRLAVPGELNFKRKWPTSQKISLWQKTDHFDQRTQDQQMTSPDAILS